MKRSKRSSIFEDLQNSTEEDLEQAALTSKLALLCTGELNQRPPEVPSVFCYHFFNCRFNPFSIMGCLHTLIKVASDLLHTKLCNCDHSTNEANQSGKRMGFLFQRPLLLESRMHPTAVYRSYQSDQLSVQPSQNIRSLLRLSSVHSQSCHQHSSCFLVKRSFYMLELSLCICPTTGLAKG